MREELRAVHRARQGWCVNGGELLGWAFAAFAGPYPRHPQHRDDQKGLKWQSGPRHPGLGREAVNLHMFHGHIDVGRKDRKQEQGKPPPGEELKGARGNEKADTADQLKDAADFDARKRKRDPGWHRRQEQLRIA